MKYNEVIVPTPNFSRGRKNTIRGVVFHHTGFGLNSSLSWLTDESSEVSAHLIIDKDGTRYILAEDSKVTWHAGKSIFKGISNCNDFMLGVEFVGNTALTPLTNDQIESAIEWLEPRWEKYRFTLEWITDHRTISPGRKIDLNKKELQRLKQSIAASFRLDYIKPLGLEILPAIFFGLLDLPYKI